MTLLKSILAAGIFALQMAAKASKPNIIFIISDDQDKLMDSTTYQPLLKKYIADEGTTFNKHFCTVALCCPSRVSLLTGKAAHNTNVTDVQGPYGGYPKFIKEGHNNNYLPVWLQRAGYKTYYTGKFMNQHGIRTYNKPFAKGWDRSDFLLDPSTYKYLESIMTLDQQQYRSMSGTYSTDNIRDRALEFLDNGIASGKPFFLGVAPIGPHGDSSQGNGFAAPIPADRHKDLFPDVQVPRRPNFNPDQAGDAYYFKTAPKLDDDQVSYLDDYYRRRLQALQSVDEIIEALVKRLEEHPDVLANTYIIYTADNGYHLGQHRLPPGKCSNMEEDINVPFFIRGPGIAKGKQVNTPTSHTDLAPTFFNIAGIPLREDFDGIPMPLTAAQQSQQYKMEHINVEYWGHTYIEGTIFRDTDYDYSDASRHNTYKTLRVVADNYDFMYAVWCSNEHTLYDMKQDPYQLNNLYDSTGTAAGYQIKQLTARLDTLLLTLKNCKGAVCRDPWGSVFPGQAKVRSLADAMSNSYDQFFASQPKVSFSACQPGYLPNFEGAYGPKTFVGQNGQIVHEARWEDYV
ncbi:hypothetical protein PWT90_07546 [Aphanocladium album]|nr:hypothetical protein PWT90_07546 [Aphanocladium album]